MDPQGSFGGGSQPNAFVSRLLKVDLYIFIDFEMIDFSLHWAYLSPPQIYLNLALKKEWTLISGMIVHLMLHVDGDLRVGP